MCGIIGYIGEKNAVPILMDGLKRLEYRGYDSAGFAVLKNNKIDIQKVSGRVGILEKLIEDTNFNQVNSGIAHTRWATHGEPSDINSHPHLSQSNRFAIVHNGIIENELHLKENLNEEGYAMVSETDSEVIAHYLEYYYEQHHDVVKAINQVANRVKGSYALGIVSVDNPDTLYAVRKDSPLIVGVGKDENFIASDVSAFLAHTKTVYFMEDDEIVVIGKDSIDFYNKYNEKIEKEIHEIEWDIVAAEKEGYEHYMMKEIMEQPKVVQDTFAMWSDLDSVPEPFLRLDQEFLKKIDRIHIVACGSAYHVGLIGKQFLESYARIPVECDVASEFRYKPLLLTEKDLVIIISQSGETSDTIAALRESKRLGAKTFAIVNVLGSTIAREADEVIYTRAGPEIAVATTKAYSCQIAVILMLSLFLSRVRNTISEEELKVRVESFSSISPILQDVLSNHEQIKYYASRFFNVKDLYFIGRGMDLALSMEGSLKLKEISYIHSEAMGAGELKHGTISLVEKGVPVFALSTAKAIRDKMYSNIKEVITRDGTIILLTTHDDEQAHNLTEFVIQLPECPEWLLPLVTIIPLQLFAYYMAVLKSCDVDKPRNLAKSVTVE